MNQKTLLLIFGANFYLFLQALEGFFRAGAAAMAFLAGAFSVTILIYKERHTLKQMLGRDQKPDQDKDTTRQP